MTDHTQTPIERLRASLVDQPDTWSLPLRLLAEALIAHCDGPPAVAPAPVSDLIDPRDIPPGCLAVEDPPDGCPYVAHLDGASHYLSDSEDRDLDDSRWWPSHQSQPAGWVHVRVIATGLVTRDDVREALRRHEQGRTT